MYDSDTSLTCTTNISTHGYQAMQAFFFGYEHFLNITGLNVSTLLIPHCGSDRKLSRTLDNIFPGGDNAELTDVFGHKHTVPIEKIIVAIGDLESSKTMILEWYLSKYSIPIIAPGSFSHWMDNVQQYTTIARMSASNTELVPAALDVLHSLHLNKIIVIYSNSPYGQSAWQIISEIADSHNVCVERSIKVDNTLESARSAASILATTENLPLAVLAFIDEEIKRPILSEIDDVDVYWRREGRVFLMLHGLPINDDEFDGLFKGSLSLDERLDFNWGERNKDDIEDEFSRYLNTFNNHTSLINRYYSFYWQQQKSCYLPNTSHREPRQHVPCNPKCLKSSAVDCRIPPLSVSDSDYIVAKYIYLAWEAVATVIHNTAHHNLENLLSDKAELLNKLLNCQVQKNLHSSDKFSLFNPKSHQGFPNYTVTQMNSESLRLIIYQYSDRNINQHNSPTFYRNDAAVSGISSLCSEIATVQPSTEDGSEKPSDGGEDDELLGTQTIILIALVAVFSVVIVIGVAFFIKLKCFPGFQHENRMKGE